MNKPYNLYRKILAWIGFSFLWLVMPLVLVWALYNLFLGETTYERPEPFYQQSMAITL